MSAWNPAGDGATVKILPGSPRHMLRAADFTLRDPDGRWRPGIGIFVDLALVQHLTRNQALALANQIVDAVEAEPVDPRGAKGRPIECPRCSKPAPGNRCPHCNADTGAVHFRMPKGTRNVR